MPHDSPSEPLLSLLDDLAEDGLADPDLDPRVQQLLRAVQGQLTEVPDERTRQAHLARIRHAGRSVRRRRALGRVGRMGAMVTVTVLVLAAVGMLPATLQQAVADAATAVGITLPAPTPASPADDDAVAPAERGDGPVSPEDVEPQGVGRPDAQGAGDPGAGDPADGPPGLLDVLDDPADLDAARLLLPPPARDRASDTAALALARTRPAEPADERAGAAAPTSQPGPDGDAPEPGAGGAGPDRPAPPPKGDHVVSDAADDADEAPSGRGAGAGGVPGGPTRIGGPSR